MIESIDRILTRFFSDFNLLLSEDNANGEWHTWFYEEHFWIWLIGFVLSLGLISMLICKILRAGEGDGESIGIGIMVGAVGSLMAMMWHMIIVVFGVVVGMGLVIGVLPVGLGYLCYRIKRR